MKHIFFFKKGTHSQLRLHTSAKPKTRVYGTNRLIAASNPTIFVHNILCNIAKQNNMVARLCPSSSALFCITSNPYLSASITMCSSGPFHTS